MRMGILLAAVFLSACETFAVPSTTTSDVLLPPDLPGSNTSRSSPTSTAAVSATASASLLQRDYTGSLPDGTGYLVSLVGGEDEHVTGIRGGFVLDVGERTIPVGQIAFRAGGGLGSAYSDGTYRSNTGGWSVAIQFSDAALRFLGEAAPEVVMGSLSTVSRLGMPVLLLDDPFSWDHDEFPLEVVYETFLVRRSCGDLALICSGNDVVQMIPARALYEGHPAFLATAASISSLGGRTATVTLGESATPR
ncbi:MAG TPA: hypothetical protein VMS99_13005 [Acidimicrobiia bacterium]|nr:hypothetical protein [Acidimicrobiia bacterium]